MKPRHHILYSASSSYNPPPAEPSNQDLYICIKAISLSQGRTDPFSAFDPHLGLTTKLKCGTTQEIIGGNITESGGFNA